MQLNVLGDNELLYGTIQAIKKQIKTEWDFKTHYILFKLYEVLGTV